MLSVTTPATVTGATNAVKFVLSMPPAKTISHVAGLREIIFPQCFHGIRDNLFVVGHPTCEVVLHGDPELAAAPLVLAVMLGSTLVASRTAGSRASASIPCTTIPWLVNMAIGASRSVSCLPIQQAVMS